MPRTRSQHTASLMRMRKPALLLLALVAGSALAQSAITLVSGSKVEFTDCSGSGSSAQAVPPGKYLMRVTDADTFICIAESAATCASGGEKFPLGTVLSIYFGGFANKSVACRSSGTGDVIFTRWQ